MQAVQGVATAATVPTLRTIRSLWIVSAVLCAAAFVLLVATAFSDYIVRLAAGETADWGSFFGQFAYPAIPMLLVGVLMVMRSQAAVTAVALGGVGLYLLLWVTIAF